MSTVKKKVLVTGGAGFLGSHLTELLLNQGHSVVVLDNLSGGYEENVDRRAEFINGSVTDRDKVKRAMEGVDVVYHLAAHAAEGQSVFCPIHNAQVNYVGSLNAIVEAINAGVKMFVFTSSMARYGKQDELPMHEGQKRQPEDPYGITKASFEHIIEIFNKVYGLDYCIIVPHNIYGPKQNLADPYRNVVGIFMNRILRGLPPIIYGDGLQKRAFTYIDDCTPYIAKAGFVKEAVGEIINVGPDEEPVTIKHLADVIIKAMDFKGKPMYMPERPQEVKYAYCSADKARRILGYRTTHTLEQGIAKMAAWAKQKGPQKPRYWAEFEIKSDRVPEVWSKKMI